ncbi:MAG TPA: hypothetical protein VJ623_09405 [Holophagaceae bacterium]|nr:hypothetical protein [Holophagaceae bacterium]HJW32271.1 hypothetical protein [Holophagaceae bacterium]
MTFNAATPSPLRRVLRDHRIIWWMLLVSLVLAWLASLPARAAFGEVLDHSLASQRLVKGFDLGTFAELMSSPEIPQGVLMAASTAQFFVFFVFLLFMAGGVNAAYASEEPLTTGEFFHACGGYFWRMVRLTLTSLLPFALVGGALLFLTKRADALAESPNERTQDYVLWAGLAGLGLLMLWVRAWFDLAQARAVAWGERGMFKTALRTFRLVTLRLYLGYVALGLLRLALTAAGIWLWLRVGPESTGKNFLVMEGLVLAAIATRLWQRATAVRALEAVARP